MAKKKRAKKTVETLKHDEAKRSNIPTAEFQSVMAKEEQSPIRLAYERRNRDLDPQLVWRGKDEQDWSDLVVHAPPLYIQEKVHPKVLIDDLLSRSRRQAEDEDRPLFADLYDDFNGLPSEARTTDFYQHEANWSNRMILGDSLQVMASLAEREGLRGRVQCIYIDPPYGIKFNSNFQWSTTSRDVKDGKADHITREPEQVKAFRDTWRDGIHSYLTYLRDRLTVARDLLADSGSVIVQIGDENAHRVRAMMDEVFGEENQVATISFQKTGSTDQALVPQTVDYLLLYAKDRQSVKYRQLFEDRKPGTPSLDRYDSVVQVDGTVRRVTKAESLEVHLPDGATRGRLTSLLSARPTGEGDMKSFNFQGRTFAAGRGTFKTNQSGMEKLALSGRLYAPAKTLQYMRRLTDFAPVPIADRWESVQLGTGLTYVVQTSVRVIERCILMATDPGDLVLDPTCGSGTTAYVAEQWGRRWITVDTSRVALALARARIMGARYPYYLLADSAQGQRKEAEITRSAPSEATTHGNIRHGFVYERVPHITLKSIANNAEIDVIWDEFQETLEPLREQLNKEVGRVASEEGNEPWEEWEIPREAGERWPAKAVAAHQRIMGRRRELDAVVKLLESVKLSQHIGTVTEQAEADAAEDLRLINEMVGGKYSFDSLPSEPRDPWPEKAKEVHRQWWEQRIARQKEIDASIAAKADFEYLYDKPYEDNSKVRVAGPFTVESVSPHRVLAVDADDELIDHTSPQRKQASAGSNDGQYATVAEKQPGYTASADDFAAMILENLKTSGVQQAHKEDKITFTSISGWPGRYVCAEGRYVEGDEETGTERRAGIFIGPEFGTVQRQDLVAAARECGDADFDVLVACGFNYEAHASEFKQLGRIPVLKARMNADLHMADDLKNTGKGNLFVIFGEPDIEILDADKVETQSVSEGTRPELAGKIVVKINGVDVFHPQTGQVDSSDPDEIACWFIDTDYNEESFFVRHAYFLGANDPYKSLKTTLKAEINQEAWSSLHSDTSRPFPKPQSNRIAVKVINHLGDEVMKVFRVE